MFKHDLTGQTYYSIREKINYYQSILSGKVKGTPRDRARAEKRLKQLLALNGRKFEEPALIVTNDKHFGNGKNKPRLCVVVDQDNKGRLFVAGVHHRTTKAIVLDRQIDRQVDERKKWIDRSEVYDTSIIRGVKPLTRFDKAKIVSILKRK